MKESKFARVLNYRDVLALAFGAIIGWSWVVLSGVWIQKAGSIGAIFAFLLGGVVVIFVGLTYAELTPALPKCGGEHIFSLRALGKKWSFVCTWALILGYVGVVAFEACALPSVVEYIVPSFLVGHLYEIAGFPIYASWVAVGVGSSIIVMIINYIGIKPAAFFQRFLTLAIVTVGILLICGAALKGDIVNIRPKFINGVGGMLSVAVMTPFMLVGFDVIPQVAEEINIPLKQVGRLLIFAIALAVLFYIVIIFSVSLLMPDPEINASSLVTADALKKACGGNQIGAIIVVIGGMFGILSSWNAFLVGGSRAIYAMAESKMLPAFLGKLHPKYRTPSNAILLVGILSCIAPFFGKAMMGWLANAGSFAVVIAYLIVVVSFLTLREKEPDLPRPYRVKRGRLIGAIALLLAGGLFIFYLPGMPSGLMGAEWTIVLAWVILGFVFYVMASVKN